MTKYTKLFQKFNLRNIPLENRFVMAPLTRSRAHDPENVPNDLMSTYYGQRTSAGLIISEASQISLQGKGYARTPGIYTKEQIEGWKKITSNIHNKGGKIFLQLWHVGSTGSAKVNGLQPIAPSVVKRDSSFVYIFDEKVENGDASFVPLDEPRAMTQKDIDQVIQEFVQGAKNAIEAGFDGVEIHGANGYLIDQFLRKPFNLRTDKYGGSQENRVRLLVEIAEAVLNVVGKDRVGLRVSPYVQDKSSIDPEIFDTILLAAQELEKLGIAYLHLAEGDFEGSEPLTKDFREALRHNFHGAIIATGGKTPDEGESLLNENLADLIGFGRNFISNPDYPIRVQKDAKINPITNFHTLFGGGSEVGYSDFPSLEEEEGN